jgi:DNA-binding helix-hairpin-helix protein with protein kinase domain
MARTLVTSDGTPIQLGAELGRGGEGSVFEVPSASSMVAKLYHQVPDAAKQSKLAFMAKNADAALQSYVAWPKTTLHERNGGPVLGFLMGKVTAHEPVHVLYSPRQRQQEFPTAHWDFLLFTARNTAAAFNALHSHGHVLGDVNQGNVMVAKSSKVVLIDSDSFQVNANGKLHLCEVGVGHFTPPELQGKSFNGLTRTANHDNFGLALLLFHLLFGGRHPFSGVPMRAGVGDVLETDIQNFRYAYARDAASRGLKPPPKSTPMSVVPDQLEAMFTAAFTQPGAAGGRPTANAWLQALDGLRSSLKRCSASRAHIYPGHNSQCPWCALEKSGVIYFLDIGTVVAQTASGFVLAKVWALIEAVPPPAAPSAPAPSMFPMRGRPLPDSVPKGDFGLGHAVVVGLAIFLIAGASNLWVLWLILAGIGWAVVNSNRKGPREEERRRRASAVSTARQEYDALVARSSSEAGTDAFMRRKRDLTAVRQEYEQLGQEEAVEMQKLQSTAQKRQLQKFLDSFFIEVANIPGVGAGRKAALRSFGIETAADVNANAVRQVKGFGENLTRAVVDWRASIERRFVFNPAQAITASDIAAVKARIAQKRAKLEGELNAGLTQLQQLRQSSVSRQAVLKTQLDEAAKKLSQASADLEVASA